MEYKLENKVGTLEFEDIQGNDIRLEIYHEEEETLIYDPDCDEVILKGANMGIALTGIVKIFFD